MLFFKKRALKRRRTERDRQNVECPSLVERQCRPSMSGPGLSSSGNKVKKAIFLCRIKRLELMSVGAFYLATKFRTIHT